MTERQSDPDARMIAENIEAVRGHIARAAAEAGRKPEEIRLMAVTKTVPAQRVRYAIDAGVDLIGENKVQELLEKYEAYGNAEKHLIGHLQSNKVGKIVGVADVIQSVDSVKIAREIAKAAAKKNITAKVLLEVNIGLEESKTGFAPDSLAENAYEIAEMGNISIEGLMCVPPVCEAGEAMKYFSQLHAFYIDFLSKKAENINMHVLSMGMSADYEEAIRGGSNLVRVGTAIFGGRVYR